MTTTTLSNDYDYLLSQHRGELDRGREIAAQYGEILADWHHLREDLQRAYDDLHGTSLDHAQRGLDVEAARVRDTASGVMRAIRRMDAIRTGLAVRA